MQARGHRRPVILKHASLGSARETGRLASWLLHIIFEFPINRVKRSFVARMNNWFIS